MTAYLAMLPGKIDPVSFSQNLSMTNGGLNNKELPLRLIQNQHRSNIRIGQFQGTLQCNIEQVFCIKSDITEIGQVP